MNSPTYEQLQNENNHLRLQLEEANDTIEAIRTGQIDALVVKGKKGHELYTLKTADQTYRVFIEKMTEGAVTLNPDGLILYSNSRFANMVNLPLSKVIGLSFLDFVTPDCKEKFREQFEKSWTEDSKGEIDLVSNNNRIVFQLSMTSLQLDEGISLSIILTDLTQQKETQQQLERQNEQLAAINKALELSNTDLQHFASVASHDLQEPLRKIQMFSHLIKEKHSAELSLEVRTFLNKIIASADRMKALIIDILSYSRLSQNTNQFKRTDLNQMLKEVLEDFEIIINEKNATIIVEDLPNIDVNQWQLRQVFQNLISNSLKFTRKDEAPHVTVTAKISAGQDSYQGSACSITIKDNGIGFDKKYANNIFSLFERLHTKDAYEGTGIGLAITKRIVENHNGEITAISEEGRGSAFTIVLPVSQEKNIIE